MGERFYPKDVFIPLPNGGKEIFNSISSIKDHYEISEDDILPRT